MTWSAISRMVVKKPWRLVVKREPSIVIMRAGETDVRRKGAFYMVSGRYFFDPIYGDLAGEQIWLGLNGVWVDRMHDACVYTDRRMARQSARRSVGGRFASVTVWACELDAE